MSAPGRPPQRPGGVPLPGKDRLREEVEAELGFHIRERIEELVAQGMDPAAAEAEVRRRFGDPARIGDEVSRIDRAGRRRRGPGEWLHGWTSALRGAARGLGRRPAHASAVVLMLALAIGANTSIFSAVDAALLRPLPVPELDRLVTMQWLVPEFTEGETPMSEGEAADLARRTDLFEAVTAFRSASATLSGPGEARYVNAALTMGDFAGVFDVRPRLGTFYPSDASTPGGEDVVVLGHALWTSLGADPDIVGRTLTLDGRSHVVQGVLPPDFRYPAGVDLWRPLLLDARALSAEQRRSLRVMVVGRLRPGVQAEGVGVPLAAEIAGWSTRYEGYGGWQDRLQVRPFLDHLSGELRPVLLVLLGAVSFVLLVACANVASLQLVRAAGRTREIAVRIAMGARRADVLRPFLAESLLFALLGGGAGLVLGLAGLRLLTAWEPARAAGLSGARLDGPVLAFTAAVSLGAALLSALAPAWRASRVSAERSLREGGSRASAGAARHGLLRAAVVAQLALTLVLVAGSGVLARSLAGLLATDPGFDPGGVTTMQITPPPDLYEGGAARLDLYGRILVRLEALPGVEAAALVGRIPFSDMILDSSPFRFVGPAPAGSDSVLHATAVPVTPDAFRALGVQMVAGRTFRPGEGSWEAPVAVIDEQFARQYFPGVEAVGQRIDHYGFQDVEIVGVVRSVNQDRLDAPYKANVYYPYTVLAYPWSGIVVRSTLAPDEVADAARRAVRDIDPGVPVHDVRTLGQRVSLSVGDRSLAAAVMGAFATLALVLALVGTYGVLSYATQQRTRELAVRVALGARPSEVTAAVVRGGTGLALLGLGMGAALYAGLARALESMLFGVGPLDPLVLGGGALALLAAAVVAAWLPARRAARVDPAVVLRGE